MNSKESIIVSLTTWSARVHNIPTVLDRIVRQTHRPDLIVLNIAYDLVLPKEVTVYCERYNVEVYRTEDTKVYKKFLPTLKRYPNDCIINIDDDFLYPLGMIEDFWNVHQKCPNNPICGNHKFLNNHFCHCGEASLTKYSYFGEYIDKIDQELMMHCTSSDIVFTYFATKSNHPYIPAHGYYGNGYLNSYNSVEPYSPLIIGENGVIDTYNYLSSRFGKLPDFLDCYIGNTYLANILQERIKTELEQELLLKVQNSYSYKIGSVFVKLAKRLAHLFGR